ncbi:hypothetical protein [Paraburkholderia terrae]|uniref:hypothetical protein n=1 Tax=Paraburkholderia terrae TaxID=311230 RepID=UPI003365706C
MLSPHEFATLMLVQAAPDQIDLARAELDTLLESRLVALEQQGSRLSHGFSEAAGIRHERRFSPGRRRR